MARLYLSDDTSDVSGYRIAYVDMRSPSASLATSVTNTSGSGDNIAATDTAGGTALKWITKPLLAATTLVTKANCSIWAKESNASANSGVGVVLDIYTSGAAAGTDFLDHNDTVECGTSIAAMRFTTVAATSQAFAAGDRIIVKLQVVAVGTMGGSQTVTIDYNGATAGADGDTYIDLLENFRVNETQLRSGATPFRSQESIGNLLRMQQSIQYGIDAGYYTSDAKVRSVLDEIQYEMNLLSPRSALSTPV